VVQWIRLCFIRFFFWVDGVFVKLWFSLHFPTFTQQSEWKKKRKTSLSRYGYQVTATPMKEEPRHHQDNASQSHSLPCPPSYEACNFGGFPLFWPRHPLFWAHASQSIFSSVHLCFHVLKQSLYPRINFPHILVSCTWIEPKTFKPYASHDFYGGIQAQVVTW
jgi:hypothetical protein